MNVTKVYWLCELCRDLDVECAKINSAEELFALVQEYHIVHFNCCYANESKIILQPDFRRIITSGRKAYNCRPERRAGGCYISYLIIDKVFLKNYKIYLPFSDYDKNEISLKDDGETIQLTSLKNLICNDKTLLINLSHYEEYRFTIIGSMLRLFNCKIVSFYDGLYELVKPTYTKSALKDIHAHK